VQTRYGSGRGRRSAFEQAAARPRRVAVDAVKISGSKLVMNPHHRLVRRLLGQRDFGFGALLIIIGFFVRHGRKAMARQLFCFRNNGGASFAFR